MNQINKDSDKILIATLAGIGLGVAAGVLLAPKNGRDAREELMRHLNRASDEVNSNVKRWTANLKSKRSKDNGTPPQEDYDLVMHGSWDDVRRQLRNNYSELTEEDLEYQQGQESELMDRLQRKIGKTRDEIQRMLSDLNFKL
ncbi:YtxH domain-containing protein [Pontibacter anaerobius]|uniref:YtxH domain-containing protein n=1 Tax=Pontibacter anaerobius TaxID=2993940 RepID=A0ABT3RCY6_9BACT|nr:YtxH domain-containing protein [Pontibacter anaerobius]MCX2739694.1 YtxH domain-containing protein [Pontibacter anaerobius]